MPAVGQGEGKLRSRPATVGDLAIRSRYFRSKVSLLSGSHQQNITFATPMSCPIPNFAKGSLFHSGVFRPVRGQDHGSRANGSFPKGAGRHSEKSPARHPPLRRRDGIARERGHPARILCLWPRLCQALCGRDARAPRKSSSHDRSRICRSILAPLVAEGGPSVFVCIRVHSWFIFLNDRPFFLE